VVQVAAELVGRACEIGEAQRAREHGAEDVALGVEEALRVELRGGR
jgi:hypothetical protein